MSAIERPASIDSIEVPGGEGAAATPSPGSDGAASARVYEELGRLAEFMPQRYREVFCFRWGLRGHFPHLVNQAARKFEVSRSTVELMLDRCLWNVARHARAQELPALREVLGEDRERWAERAWAHAATRSASSQRRCCGFRSPGWMCLKRIGLRASMWSTSVSGEVTGGGDP